MQALVGTSKDAFSKTTLLCYYRIVRELYSADSPDWSSGGARAGNGGESTAFITGECIRAVATFARTHNRTSEFFKRTYDLHQRREQLRKLADLEHWCINEIERVGLAWYTSTNVHLGEIALNLRRRAQPVRRIDFKYVDDYLKLLPADLDEGIRSARQHFKDALKEIRDYRQGEREAAKRRARAARKAGKQPDQRYIRSQSAHLIAESVVQQAVRRANKALKICREDTLGNLNELSKLFATITRQINQILEPAKRFLGAVLDRELTAAATTSQPAWDARELVFAAVSYSAVTEWKQDERLTRACSLLSKAISEQGLFPAGRPFHSTLNGYSLYAGGFEVARGFAQLLQKVDFPIEPQLIGRMLQLFTDNMMPVEDKAEASGIGWHTEAPPVPKKPTLWVTAIAVLALDRIVRMLDHKINERILEYFSAKRFDKEEKGLSLETLVFPDYASCFAPPKLKGELPLEQRRNWSIAITLEQMRAHLLGTMLPKDYLPSTFSCLLFGPPGTGKTTLIEALACSCKLPLIQITPSDIAVAGEAAIESRAKIIFDALSMLTKVVIIFDEFEPILLKRDPNGTNEERSIFTFLTPGMLPKLKTLYESAKRQAMAYCLVTNHYEKLDEAAIRRGRFDDHIAIYHPDFLSRAGALLDNLHKWPELGVWDEERRDRFEKVVKWTDEVSVEDLVKDLFRVSGEKKLDAKTFAAYVIHNSPKAHTGRVRPHAKSGGETNGSTRIKVWIEALERELTDSSLSEVLKKLRHESASK
jgi:adenylate kinase family enzyme